MINHGRIRIRVVGNDNTSHKPELGYTYPLVFIKGNYLTERLGNESTSAFHIYDDGKLFGNLKVRPELHSTEIKNQIEELEFSKIVKVGSFEVKKVITWGNGNQLFSIHGVPILYSKILCDVETDKWQNELNCDIEKYSWNVDIDQEKINYDKNKKNELIIKNEGWDSSKPLDINNHPPDMDYPPNIWRNIPLELSKGNKTGYKCIYRSRGNGYYYKKDKYITSVEYNSPVIAAYEYALFQQEKQKNTVLYPDKRYIYCPFEDKDECKRLGGKFDMDKKMWYIPKFIENEYFNKWLYPYKNDENYIEKQILYWFFLRYYYANG